MKICFLITDISSKGGSERVTSIIASGLIDRGYEVDIISCRNNPISFFPLNQNIKIHLLNVECEKNGFLHRFSNIKKMWKLACNQKYDVIVAVDIYLFLYLFPLQIMKKTHCIAWEHFNCNVYRGDILNLSRTLAVKFADKIVVLGKQDLQNYTAKYKNANNIVYIYNPLILKKAVNKNLGRHRVIAAGRFAKEKGFDLLIDAWNIIEKNDKSSDWILDIYGAGELKGQLLNQIESYGLERIHLNGYSNNLSIEYLNSSIFVLSSRYEGFGLVLIEAQACGLPCISFDHPTGPREIIDDSVNGYLVEPGNTEQLADKMLKLMCNEELRKEFSANAYKDLYQFDLETILNKWEGLFNGICSLKN